MFTTIDFKEYQEYLKMLSMDKSQKTINSYTYSIEMFLEYFKIKNVVDIDNMSTNKCREYQSYLLERGLNKSSINTYFRPVNAFMSFLIDNEYIKKSPLKIKSLKPSQKLPNFLSDDEIEKMRFACKRESDRLIFVLMLSTGLRRNELVTLKLSDLNGCHIIIRGKGDKERSIILQPQVLELLVKYIEERKTKWGIEKYQEMFLSQLGKPFTGEAIRYKIQSIGRKAGISEERLQKITPHVLRHTFATNLACSGADIRSVQGALGHQNLKTTEIYAHLKSSALDQALLNQPSVLGDI